MPQILRNLSYDDYVKIEALRHSNLTGFKRTALHARYEMLEPEDDTPSTQLGTALHACVFEPSTFTEKYAVSPKFDKRTTAGKAAWHDFQHEHPNVICLSDVEFDGVRGMADAIYGHPFIQSILPLKSLREIVVLWDESTEDGIVVPCKARIDWCVQAGQTFVLDLKSTRDASASAFAKWINNYSYHTAAASYLRGIQACAPITDTRRWLWVAVENTKPHGIAIYEASEGLLKQGEFEYVNWLRAYARAQRDNVWPGYPEQITPIDLPRWAQMETE